MSKWKTVFEEEVEGRPVTIRIYEDDEDEGDDAGPAVRVATTSIHDYEGALERNEDGQTLIASPEAAGASITLEPVVLDDLEEELREVGFSAEAAALIGSKVPQ